MIVFWKVCSSLDLSWKSALKYVVAVYMTIGKTTELFRLLLFWDRGRSISTPSSSVDRDESPS